MILNNLSQPAAEREGRIKVTIQTWAASYDSKPLWADNAKSRERVKMGMVSLISMVALSQSQATPASVQVSG